MAPSVLLVFVVVVMVDIDHILHRVGPTVDGNGRGILLILTILNIVGIVKGFLVMFSERELGVQQGGLSNIVRIRGEAGYLSLFTRIPVQ